MNEQEEKDFDEKCGQFYVSIDSKTKAIRIVDIVNGIKVNGEDGTLIECVASGDIKKYINLLLKKREDDLVEKIKEILIKGDTRTWQQQSRNIDVVLALKQKHD